MSVFRKKPDASLGQGNYSPYIIGRVNHVVMGPFEIVNGKKNADPYYQGPASIGMIKYDLMYSTISGVTSKTAQEPAFPIFSFIKQLPVIGEMVLVVPGPTEGLNDKATYQQFFYFPPFSVWNKVNHGVFPNMNQLTEVENNNAAEGGYQGSEVTGSSFPMGKTFVENDKIRNLKLFEGDTVLQSRFGQSIRFGSTVRYNHEKSTNPQFNQFKSTSPKELGIAPGVSNTWSKSGKKGDPITIIVNSQGERRGIPNYVDLIEDINKDGSSIYMTSTQEILLQDLAENVFPLKSFGVRVTGQVLDSIPPPIELMYFPLTNENISATDQDQSVANSSGNPQGAIQETPQVNSQDNPKAG